MAVAVGASVKSAAGTCPRGVRDDGRRVAADGRIEDRKSSRSALQSACWRAVGTSSPQRLH
jgi:hypothetical protein